MYILKYFLLQRFNPNPIAEVQKQRILVRATVKNMANTQR